MKNIIFLLCVIFLFGCKQSPDEEITSPEGPPPERVETTFTVYIKDAINQQPINGWVRTDENGVENVLNGKKVFTFYLYQNKYLFIYSVGASGYKTVYYDTGLQVTLYPGDNKQTTFYLYPGN